MKGQQEKKLGCHKKTTGRGFRSGGNEVLYRNRDVQTKIDHWITDKNSTLKAVS